MSIEDHKLICYRSWLELPEALTALLIPLPFLFASLAYPSVITQARRLPSTVLNAGEQLLETLSNNPDAPSVEALPRGSRLLHACTLTSTTLILVGLISKIRSSTQQPLDRRKSFGNTEKAGGTLDALWGIGSVWRIITNVLGMVLPFYATMQLGGARTGLLLLVAVSAGLGGLDLKPGKHTLWDALKRTFRTRKATCATVVLTMLLDVFFSTASSAALLGYFALTTSIVAMPPPLPTAGWSLVTGFKGQNESWSTQGSARLSLPKPSSPLINTPEDTLLTLGSGIVLMVITVLYSILFSTTPSASNHAMVFSVLSVASATALIYFALPSALRTQKKAGLGFGCILVAAFAFWEQQTSWQTNVLFPLICALAFGAITFDTRAPAISQTHSHDHSHSGHKQSHAHHDHDHHLHGNHSRLSALLISSCTPGSILHSILIEKDSRRIAYFGV
jgi:zinc transporter 5/7